VTDKHVPEQSIPAIQRARNGGFRAPKCPIPSRVENRCDKALQFIKIVRIARSNFISSFALHYTGPSAMPRLLVWSASFSYRHPFKNAIKSAISCVPFSRNVGPILLISHFAQPTLLFVNPAAHPCFGRQSQHEQNDA
jgi:hypothetical protein